MSVVLSGHVDSFFLYYSDTNSIDAPLRRGAGARMIVDAGSVRLEGADSFVDVGLAWNSGISPAAQVPKRGAC